MGYVYNDNTGNYDWEPDEPQYTEPAAPPPQPMVNGTDQEWRNPDGGRQYWDLDYWQRKGFGPDQIFDENGQLRPGWQHTQYGYDRTGGDVAPPPPPPGYNPPPPGYNPPPPTTTDGGGVSSGGGFSWPTFNAPTYTRGPAFQAQAPFSYDPFSYESFKAPEFNDIYKDGSFIGRRDEGTQAIEHGAAAKGLTRLPQTLKALAGWNQDFASREYGNIFDRAANTYDRNRGNAFGNWQANRNNAADNYSLNYGISRDVWDRGEQQNLSAFDRNYKSAYDSFDLNQWQPSKLTFDDMYRRYRDELDATTRIALGGGD